MADLDLDAIERQLGAMPQGAYRLRESTTHWDDCYLDHPYCAMVRLIAEVRKLREDIANRDRSDAEARFYEDPAHLEPASDDDLTRAASEQMRSDRQHYRDVYGAAREVVRLHGERQNPDYDHWTYYMNHALDSLAGVMGDG